MRSETRPRSYLAVLTPAAQTSQIRAAFALSPRVMQWAEGVWLFDFGMCESYWRAKSTQKGLSLADLLQRIILDFGGEQASAAWTDHPWRSILLATYMKERQLPGLLTHRGPFNATPTNISPAAKVAGEISWSAWWECLKILEQHFIRGERSEFKLGVFRRQCNQLQKAAQRLGWRYPVALGNISLQGIGRRFGPIVKDMVDWTYEEHKNSFSNEGLLNFAATNDTEWTNLGGFPWHSYQIEDCPKIQRHLETSLGEWTNIEHLLREDFDRLCTQESWSSTERVVSMEWRLILDDEREQPIPIVFRHPHALHSEIGEHQTAMIQALYAFHGHEKATQQQQAEGCVPPLIIGWHITVQERLLHIGRVIGLFGDQDVLNGDLEESKNARTTEEWRMLQLENRLPLSLDRFVLQDDWTPEGSFRKLSCGPPCSERTLHQGTLMLIAKNRPLFIFKNPYIYDERNRQVKRDFIERVMQKWWDRELSCETPKNHLQRDYYRLQEDGQRDLWAFRDQDGKVYIHGIFG